MLILRFMKIIMLINELYTRNYPRPTSHKTKCSHTNTGKELPVYQIPSKSNDP